MYNRNKHEANNLQINVDLAEQAVNHLAFLKAVDSIQELKNPDILKRAVYRYEKYWLPLAADYPNECLCAPIDIEWVWHCHMLCPAAYEKDCQGIVGTTVNHKLHDLKHYNEKQQKSMQYWCLKYKGEGEPFVLDWSVPYNIPHSDETYMSKISYGIVAAAERQKVFYYQVSLPHYHDKKYLANSILRYKQFLYLKTQLPRAFLVPCYDIDLVWHTHQLNPLIYKHDMVKIIGHLFNHDDTVNDRSPNSTLYNADKDTRAQWKHFYNESFSLFGAMYRGQPPVGSFLYKITKTDAYMFSTKSTFVSFYKMTLNANSSNPKQLKKFKLTVSSALGSRNDKTWFTLKRPADQPPRTSSISWSLADLRHQYKFDTNLVNSVKFCLQRTSEWGGSRPNIGLALLNIVRKIESFSSKDSGGQIQAQLPLGDNTLHIQGHFNPPKQGETILYLNVGYYEHAIVPENIQTLWGPVALERLPPGTDNKCLVASHRLTNHLGNVEFTARTIHSQALMMSVVHVFYHDKLVAIGHLVASDQLPLPTQVSKDVITLNPRQGERAVLIKNSGGDWGIVTGRWKGFKTGLAGTKYRAGVRGCAGTLFVKFFKCSTGVTTTVELGYLRKQYEFRLDASAVDLMKGILTIDSSRDEVAENITLAFSVSLLHVLCVPRPKGWKEGDQVKSLSATRGIRELTIIPSDDMAFIMAAGLLRHTPSNYFMHSLYGLNICAMCGGGGDGVMAIDGSDFAALPGGDADGGDAGCDGSACGGTTVNGIWVGGGCGGCGGCGGGWGGLGGSGGGSSWTWGGGGFGGLCGGGGGGGGF